MAIPVESKIVVSPSDARPGFLPGRISPISAWMSFLPMMFLCSGCQVSFR
jgi:hypothetical protein